MGRATMNGVRSLVLVTAVVVGLALGCASSAVPEAGPEFRAQFETVMLDEIADAGLPGDLESLAITSLSFCLDSVEPSAAEEIEPFTDCYAENLCASELVAPVWDGDTRTCVEEAKASFDFGG